MAGLSAVPSWIRPMLEARHLPESLTVDRWLYTTDGVQVQPLTVAMEVGLPGTGTSIKLKNREPRWVRFVATVACSHISADDDPDLQYTGFKSFLEMPLVKSLIDSLTTDRGPFVSWWRSPATRPGLHEALLRQRWDVEGRWAVASARLELPTEGRPMYGRDGRCATMILHVFQPGEPGRLFVRPGRAEAA
jgi:hypothetical protein